MPPRGTALIAIAPILLACTPPISFSFVGQPVLVLDVTFAWRSGSLARR